MKECDTCGHEIIMKKCDLCSKETLKVYEVADAYKTSCVKVVCRSCNRKILTVLSKIDAIANKELGENWTFFKARIVMIKFQKYLDGLTVLHYRLSEWLVKK